MVTINLNYSKLRGRIREKCGTEGAFAKSIGRSSKFISDVFQGRAYFNAEDIYKAVEVLQIPIVEIGEYFFCHEVHETKLCEAI